MLRAQGIVASATLALLVATFGCGIDSAPKAKPAVSKTEPGKTMGKPAAGGVAVHAEDPTADQAPKVDPPPAVEPAVEPTPAPAAEGGAAPAKDLGDKFRDPAWFRKTMFNAEQGKAVKTSRSEADDAGRFKSHILFELDGVTLEACAKQLDATVKPSVANLKQSKEPDGRLKLEGSTDRYNVTMLCGEAKGKTRAYVSYEWTS